MNIEFKGCIERHSLLSFIINYVYLLRLIPLSYTVVMFYFVVVVVVVVDVVAVV